MKNKVSIIIPNFNGKKWLKKCLTTLSHQTYSDIEIIVVDNGSTDDSTQFIKDKFPKVRIIFNKKNLGFAKANNQGIKSSIGKYILLINSDTWVEKDLVTTFLNFYKKNDYSVVSAIERKYDNKISVAYNPTIDITGSHVYLYPIRKKEKLFYFAGVCLFFSKEIYLTTKGLDNDFFMYFEDTDWFWRLALLNKKISYVNDAFVYHKGAGGAGYGIRYNTFLWRNQNILQMLIKNYSVPMLLVSLPLYFTQNLVEILFFLLILKPKIAYSYLEGWWFNFKYLPRTLRKRKWVQKHRKISDLQVMRKMYIGSGKLLLLINYFKIAMSK